MESTQKQADPIASNMEISDDADFYDVMQARYKNEGPRTAAQVEEDVQYFVNHPLNAKAFTPEMLDLPEYQALQALAYEGTPLEVAKNFKNHAYERLNKVLMKESKNDTVDIEQGIYCFDQALEQKHDDKDLLYYLYIGRAKANILIGQFGRTKEDCLEARKYKETEQSWSVLLRSRIFVEKYQEALEYGKQAIVKFGDSRIIKDLIAKAESEFSKEKKRIDEISTMTTLKQDKKYQIYKNLRGKKVKIGKQVHHLPEIVDVNIFEDSEGFLHFPVLILYDEFMATDFVQDWREDQTIKSHMKEIFNERAPWDDEGKYRMDTIEVYFEADSTTPLDPKDKAREKSTKKYVRCNLDSSLLEVLQHQFHIVPQYPVLKVICKKGGFKSSFLNEI
eukprot:403368683